MTILAICSVYDTVANLYGSPFTATNKQTAIRQFHAECAVPDRHFPMQTNPADFRLFALGSFDDQTGTYNLLSQPEFLTQGTPKE